QVGVGIADAEHDLPPALTVPLAPGAVAAIRADAGERLGGIRGDRHRLPLRPVASPGVVASWVEIRRGARRWFGDLLALSGWDDERVALSRAPGGIAAHTGDAELSREFQMFGELIAIH